MAQSPDTIVVPVYGMTCGRCEAKVSESIMALGTGLSVVAEREHDRVTIVGSVDVSAVREAVTELGYRLEPPPHETARRRQMPTHRSRQVLLWTLRRLNH